MAGHYGQDALGLNQDELKRRNRSQILNTILEHGVICRRDIAARTGLTAATVSNLTAELLACGIIEEVGSYLSGDSRRGGPNPILLSLNLDRPLILALHLDPKALDAGLVNLQGKIVARTGLALPPGCTFQTLLAAASDLATELSRKAECHLKQDILGISFATSGNISKDGYIATHRHIPFIGFPVRTGLRNLFELPVFVGNTARSMALAEAWFGQGRVHGNYLFVLVDDFVDGAIVVNRAVLVGRRHFSCLIAHHPIDPNGPLCHCGQRGCIEVMASDTAILRQGESIAAKTGSVLNSIAEGRSLSLRLIVEAAARGDELCREVLVRRAALLGKAIAESINVIDVEAVVLAMRFAAPAPNFETEALRKAYAHSLCFRDEAPEIVFSEMNDDLPIIGSATLAIRRVFSARLTIVPNGTGGLTARVSS